MDHLYALALILAALVCSTLAPALIAARRTAPPAAESPVAAEPPPVPAPLAPPQSAQEAAMLEVLCQDLRARTSGVVGMAEQLLATPLPEDQMQQAGQIADSGRTMLRLLGDVLDVTRIDAGGLQLQAEPSDLRDLLGHSVNLMQASARAKGLSLVLVVDDAVPQQMVLDRARLRQVMLNLIGNAVKFSPAGRIDVQARVAQTPAGPQLAISVIDPGVGIARDRQGDVFQPFYRHTPAIEASGPLATSTGTGLGLALSSRLVRAMGGDIALESAPGLGSCFTVRLPLVIGPIDPPDTVQDAAAVHLATDPQRLGDLQARYRNRKEALFACLRDLAAQPDHRMPDARWDHLDTQLQRLAGVAASFGDDRLGRLASQLHGELRDQANPRLRQEVLLRHWDALQAARGV